MSTPCQLEDRVSRVEGELRRWRLIGAACACITLAAVCMAAAPSDNVPTVVRANGFELIDDNGNVAAELETAENGARLSIKTTENYSSASLVANDNRSGLYLGHQGEPHGEDDGVMKNSASLEAYQRGGVLGMYQTTEEGRYFLRAEGGKGGTEIRIKRPPKTKTVQTSPGKDVTFP